jgi:predicted methyltransferase
MKSLNLFIILSLSCLSMVSADTYDDIISKALNNPARATNNVARDESRKPGEIIKFMDVQPGMTVLDMVSNGGFYAEILANVVGDNGRIIAHTFAPAAMDPDFPYAKYIRESNHMNNVVLIYANFADLVLKENTLDRVFLVQNYHDLYFDRPGYGVDDVQPVLTILRKALKPGGVMAIIDHETTPGAPSSTGTTLHRINSDVVKNDMQAAGFVLAGSLDILMNTTDDKTKSVFDPANRGKTSRFILKFVSPD